MDDLRRAVDSLDRRVAGLEKAVSYATERRHEISTSAQKVLSAAETQVREIRALHTDLERRVIDLEKLKELDAEVRVMQERQQTNTWRVGRVEAVIYACAGLVATGIAGLLFSLLKASP